MDLPVEVNLQEVAPRDGLQSIKDFVPTDKKLQIIQAVQRAGIKEIEATSFVNSKAIPQLRDAAELMAAVPRDGTVYNVLIPNLMGAQNAIDAKVDKVEVFISASEAHNQGNVRRSVAESMSELNSIFDLAKEHNIPIVGAVAVAFGCPYQGDVPIGDVFRIVESYLERGAASITMGDTTGMATPKRVEEMVRGFQKHFPKTPLNLHFHNNRGTAMANLLAGLEAGATKFDTSLGGIGGCPYVPRAAGNLPTEDVVYMLEEMGVHTGIDLEVIIRAAHLLQKILGFTLPGQVMKSGPRDPELAARICDEVVQTVPVFETGG